MPIYSAIVSDTPGSTAILSGSVRENFRRASEAGYDAVQLTICKASDYDLSEVLSLMKEFRLSVSALATGRVYMVDGLSMGSDQEGNRSACVRRMCELADFCAAVGGAGLVVGAVRGLFRDAASPEAYYAAFDRSLREICAYCEPIGVPVMLESDDHLEADAYCDPAETLSYVRAIGSPVLHMYLDIFHLVNEGMEPVSVIREYGRSSWQIDISGEKRLSPVESSLNFREILQAVRDSGFEGVFAFEIPEAPPEDSAVKSLAYVKKIYEELV